jgi:hypothetical protein
MPNGTYGGVRGKETKVGQKTFVSRPTRLERSDQTVRKATLPLTLNSCNLERSDHHPFAP